MGEERNKISILLYACMLMAIALGVYAQDIAYYLYNNLDIPLLAVLSLVTILSILLFLTPPILVSKVNKQNKVRRKELNIYLGINASIGMIISVFSLVVLVAWWG